MATFISHSPADTESLGETWGRAATSGLVIGLTGDLGAGKTQLVKGIARGLGVTSRVHSPTFALVNQYEGGRLPLFHLDLYRLNTREQLIGAGLEEFFRPAGVTVVEWIERWLGEVQNAECGTRNAESGQLLTPHSSLLTSSAPLRLVQIEVLSETQRRITYEDTGA